MILAILMGYPCINWAVLRSILSCIYGPNYRFCWKPHICCALAVVSSTLVIGILVPNLSVVLNFVGSTASTWLLLGLPCLLSFKLKVVRGSHCLPILGLALFVAVSGIIENVKNLYQ